MLRSRLVPTAGTVLAGTIAAGALGGCAVSLAGAPATQTRPVAPFDRIDVHGLANVVLRPGSAGTLTLSGSEHPVRQLRTTVRGSTLELTSPSHRGVLELGYRDVTVIATVPSLRAVRIEGSGSVDAAGLDTPSLSVQIDGSGSLRASGHAGAVDGTVRGSGHLYLARLITDHARFRIAGSGSIAAEPSLSRSCPGGTRAPRARGDCRRVPAAARAW